MRILSYIIFASLLLCFQTNAQSPHGNLKGLDCSDCHESTNWKIAPSKNKFDHSNTIFELTGQHRSVNCSSCHIDLKFSNAQTNCNSCHKDIHQNTVGTDCSSCHKTDTWLISNRNDLHEKSRFPLLGSHLKADCIQCHSGYPNLKFATLGINCVDCHLSNYQTTQNPNHALSGFSTDCLDCHSFLQDKWSAEIFAHNFFPLTGGHNVQSCFSCHQPGGNFTGLSAECYSCHKNDYDASTSPPHLANSFPTDCKKCHTIQVWKPANFDHNATQFPLTGAHVSTDCASCHKTGYTAIPTSCVSCHQSNFNSTTNPNHTAIAIPTDCQTCHTTNPGWKPATFSIHDNYYQLIGAHASIANNCASCHNGNYNNTPNTCYACHTNDYNTTLNPPHASSGFNTECQSCHSQNAWKPANWDHDGQYFPIYTGTHNGKWNTCADCHTVQSNYSLFSCIDCHEHNKTKMDDEHQGVSGYVYASNECLSCHPRGTKEGAFNHSTSIFPLTGAHQTVDCSQCHKNGYANTPTSCYECHQPQYNSSTNPNHAALSISTECSSCHTTASDWKPATFSIHDNYYQLIGAHASIANNCASCHNGNYSNTPNTCFACHTNDYNTALNPHHASSGFNTECQSCHSQTAWKPANWDHDGQYFPIYSGEHNGKWNTCADCHTVQSNFSLFSCIDCHEHNKTKMDDEHQGISGYVYASNECLSCHPKGTKEGAFDHSTSIFPLTGAHQTVDCSQCHKNGYANTPTSCNECHQLQYNSSTNPNHAALSISTECSSCHTTNPGWKPAQFPQHDTYFALTGAHATISNDCSKCHNGNYNNIANTCLSCHQTAYSAAVNPNHTLAGLSNACETCHSSSAWIPSSFNHTSTGFTLEGNHSSIQCSSCHKGTTAGLNSLCVSCHQDDYNSAQNHVTQGFPTDCGMCHNAVAWNQATFNHNNTNFQLTGAHVSVECSNCHKNGYTNTSTECSSCHTTNFNNTANPNHVSLNLSLQCQSCHTTNPGWKPATFPIHDNFFQLIGAHAAIQNNCSSCHTNGYTNTPNECYGCHQSDYANTNDPPHQSSQFPTDCLPCHSQNAWTPATFDHDNPYFPIYSGKHKGKWDKCSDCHTNSADYSVFSCIDCHEHNKTKMDDEHRGKSGYVYASWACYDCHPRGSEIRLIQKIKQRAN